MLVILEEKGGEDDGGLTHFDVFAEKVGVETQPVPGDVESPLQQDVPQQRTGIHCSRRDTVGVKGGKGGLS